MTDDNFENEKKLAEEEKQREMEEKKQKSDSEGKKLPWKIKNLSEYERWKKKKRANKNCGLNSKN